MDVGPGGSEVCRIAGQVAGLERRLVVTRRENDIHLTRRNNREDVC